MITFAYTAKNQATGETVKAEVQAENEQAAAKLLIEQNLFPISIEASDKESFLAGLGKHVRAKDTVIFTRQLATLINAGLPLTRSLRTVQDQISSQNLKDIVNKILISVEGGSSLSAAFAQYPKIFNQIYISLVAAGESSGTLDKTLTRIADQQEKDAAIASKIRGALIYPAIVLVVIVLVIIFMLVTILPQVSSLYASLGKTLPITTIALLDVANFVIHFWWLAIAGIGGGIYGLLVFFRTERGRRLVDKAKLSAPVFGKLYKKVYMARFSRTLGVLLASGIPMLEALATVRNAINNLMVADVLDESIVKVRGGKTLSSTLEGKPEFLTLVPQMIGIGEQSGTIDEMLGRVASFYEGEVDEEIRNLSTTMEPLLMVVLGVLVGGIIVAVLLPIYSLVGSGIGG